MKDGDFPYLEMNIPKIAVLVFARVQGLKRFEPLPISFWMFPFQICWVVIFRRLLVLVETM